MVLPKFLQPPAMRVAFCIYQTPAALNLKQGRVRVQTNYVEALALKLHMLFALEKDCMSIQVFGDLKLIINWVSKI